MPEPAPLHPAGGSKTAAPVNAPRLWTIGASAGTSFAAPWVTGTVHATLAPLKHSFLEIGVDAGMVSGDAEAGYYSLYPFAHYALFAPFGKSGGWYVGAGGGCMIAKYDLPEGKFPVNIPAADVTTGFNIGNVFDVSWTLRTNFAKASNKVSVGWAYRFK